MCKLKKMLSFVICIAMTLGMVTTTGLAAQTAVTYGYDNLNNEAGELNIAFIGGSITIGSSLTERYATHVANWFQEKYPNKTVNQINAGMGGTPSQMAKYRIVSDICAHEPDVVFIEFAVNDSGYAAGSMTSVKQNMETMVRRLLSLPKQPVIIFLYSMDKDTDGSIAAYSIPAHREVARYYNLGEVNFYDYMSKEVAKGTYVWNDGGASGNQLSDDGTHPNFAGHRVYGDYIISQMETTDILRKADFVNAPLCRTVTAQTNARDVLFSDDSIVRSGSWVDAASTDGHYYPGIKASATGDYLTYTFAGADSIGFMHMGGCGTWIIDEGTENEVTGTVSAASNHSYPHFVICRSYPNLSEGEHTLKIVNTGTDSKTNLRFMRILISDGENTVSHTTDATGDHVPGSVPPNLLMDDNNAGAFSGRNSGSVSCDWHDSPRVWKWTATSDFGVNSTWPVQGSYSAPAVMFADPACLKANTTYAMSIPVKKQEDCSPVISIAYIGNSRITSNEYGTTGYAPGSTWERFNTTITLDSKTDGHFMMGFPSAKAGDCALIDLSRGVYFGEEVAYDITNKALDKDVVAAGKSRRYGAQIVNQTGIPGKTSQNFNWSVVNSAGEEEDTISLTTSDNTATVSVQTSEATPVGTYYVRAYSTDYKWQKSAKLTVVESLVEYDDYKPDESTIPENIIKEPANASYLSNSNGASDHTSTSSTYTWIELKKAASTTWGAGKTLLNLDKGHITKGFSADTSYVVSARLRNDTADTRPSLTFGISCGQNNPPATLEITNSQFETKALAFRPAKDATYINIGLATTVDRSNLENFGQLTMDISNGGSLYVAEEIAYDITNEVTGSSRIIAGSSTNLQARIVNQAGITGNLNQDMSFVVLDADRTEEVSGFSFEENTDGTTRVTVADTVPGGSYVILATSEANPEMRMGAQIDVVDASEFADHTPTMPANMIEDPDDLNDLTKINGAGGEYINNWQETGSTDHYILVEKARATNDYWRTGPVIQTATYPFEKGSNYVVSVRLRNDTPDIGYTPSFAIGNFWELVYSKPIANTEYETIADTFTATQDTDSICFGFDARYASPGGARISMDISGGGSLYVAREQPYDIVTTSEDSPNVFTGGSMTISSKVVNQVGLSHNMLRNFSYTLLNGDRTAYAKDITVTKSDDGNATINIGESAPAGEYVVLVSSLDYPGIQKGFTFTVLGKDTFADYVPDESKKPANIVANPTNINHLVSHNGHCELNYKYEDGSSSWAAGQFFDWRESTQAASKNYGAGPTSLLLSQGRLTKSLTKGTDYVLSVRLKNKAPEVKEKLTFALACNYVKTPSVLIDVSNTQYETKTAVFTAPEDTTMINLGFDASVDRTGYTALGILTMDLTGGGSLYIAEEVAYDITNTCSSSAKAYQGGSLELEAAVVNQVGTKGNIKQNFSWIALNEDRTAYADGITIREGEGGKSTVHFAPDIPAGKYVILAMSDDYSGMRKGIEVEVMEKECISQISLVFPSPNKAVLNAGVVNTSAETVNFIITSYNGDSLENTTARAVAASDFEAKIENLEIATKPGNTIRVYIWDGLRPLPNLNNLETEFTVPGENALYGDSLSAADYEEISAANYYGGKQAAVTITFDDGNYSAAVFYDELFRKNNMRGTAMLVSDWMKADSVPLWQALIDKGAIDVGNHSKSHSIKYASDSPTADQLKEDITDAHTALKEMFPKEKIITFATPWTQTSADSLEEIGKNHIANRTCGRGFLSADPTDSELMNIPSIIVENTSTTEGLTAYVDTAIANGTWLSYLMHGVGDGTYNIKADVCEEFFGYIGSRKDYLWAGSLNDLVLYIKERQNSSIERNWIKENAMSISLTDTLDDSMFDFPLTLLVNIPSYWDSVNCYHDGKLSKAEPFIKNGKRYVYVNVVPDKGEIILFNQ